VAEARRIRVLIADDHPIVRVGLRNRLNQQPDMEVVAEAADGREAVQAFTHTRPDVTLMDLRMPVLDGPEAIAFIIERDLDARIIVLTTYDGDDDIERAVRAGACGYLLKDSFPEGMLDAIRAAHAGQGLFTDELAARFNDDQRGRTLSPRELSVLELIARGLSNKEIQSALSIAEGTLKNHLKRIFDKLEVGDRTRAVMVGLKRGLIRMP
jgi:two-component system NarL family response regulator